MSADDLGHLTIPSIETIDEYTIEKIIAAGEGKQVEFKSQLPPPSILACVIASFANSEGGVILIGINEDRIIEGISERDQKQFLKIINLSIEKINPHPKMLRYGLKNYKNKVLGVILAWHDEVISPLLIKNAFFERLGNANLRLGGEDFIKLKRLSNPPIGLVTADEPKFVDLSLPESEINKFMDLSDEDAFCEVLLVPFLRKIGFRSVQRKGHRDKSLEFGQDIRSFKIELPTGHWLYFTAQVKIEDLIYSPSRKAGKENIDKVITQLSLALGREMFDCETNTKVLPDHVLFVSSGGINEGAREYMEEMLARDKQRRILFLGRDILIERILKMGLPEGCQIAIRQYLASKGRA